jgi:hypothetical protein
MDVPDAGARVDAGTDGGAMDADAGARDPAAVEWVMGEPPAEGPLLVWGFVTAPLGDGRAVLFGGTTANEISGATLDGTWLYDMRGDTPVTSEIESAGPAPRYCACAAYDPDRDVVVLTGGRNLEAPLSVPPETWELDLATETWARAGVPETPGAVIGCGLAYGRAAGAMFLFGGAGTEGHPDTTWRYDPAAPAWVALDATGPVGRYDPSFLPMEDGRRLLLFAGSVGAMGAAFYSDVWIFDTVDESWAELAVEGATPPGRRTPWTAWEPGERGLYAANGYDGRMEPIGDFWHLDLDVTPARWTELPSEGAPGARGFSQPLPGLRGTLGTMFGGFDGSRPIGELWMLRAR